MVEAFVQHGLQTTYTDLSPEAVRAVRTYLLDTIGVGIAGAAVPLTSQIRKAAASWSGSGSANIWGGDGYRTAPANAAFVNGFQIHCQEFDCVHEPAVVHPLATILAALMAECDAQGAVSGKSLTVAMAVAVDLAVGIGISVTSPIKFFRPANAGIFGATLGVARLRKFSAEQTKDALGYALAFNSGTMQAHVEGKPALPIQIANAARGALMACDLAQQGVPGPHDSLEGPFGYFALFEDAADTTEVVEQLGKIWRIAEVSHKPFPTGRAAQGGIVLLQMLREKGVTAENLEKLTLSAPPLIARLVGRPIRSDMSVNYARLCFQYSGAIALRTGQVGLEDFTVPKLADAATQRLGKRIQIVDDGTPDPAAFTPQTALAHLTDGTQVEARIETLYGAPNNRMSDTAHVEKFRRCVAFGFGQARPDLTHRLINLTEMLDEVADVSVLSRLAAGLEA